MTSLISSTKQPFASHIFFPERVVVSHNQEQKHLFSYKISEYHEILLTYLWHAYILFFRAVRTPQCLS